jgi:glycosyltransferase involved in cell wall biosynthesis
MCLGVRAMPGITATIITFNEELRIAEAIASLSCCDEVIVVDSGSTDQTRDIARGRGARVIEHPWEGYSKQKNVAAGHARNDWILSVDADERLSIELADEITQWKKLGESSFPQALRATPFPEQRAWSMPRRVFYLGKWIKHSGWYPDRKIRLYDKKYCRWEGDFVHEWVHVHGSVGNLHADLLHFPYRDWKDHEARIERYTELAAQAARSKGSRGSVLKLLLGPPFTFVKGFLLHAGFLDGWRGAAIAYMGARYVFSREFRILR